MLVIELKSEALKDRHWKQLMKRLHVNWVVSELTLGQIWDVDLQKNEAIVKDVLLVAQGEMALEEFLKQVNSGAGCTSESRFRLLRRLSLCNSRAPFGSSVPVTRLPCRW